MEDSDYLAIESLVENYFLTNGPLPGHETRGARIQWFVELLQSLSEVGYGSDFVFFTTSVKSAFQLIMGASFQKGSRTLTKDQRALQDFINNDLRKAISLAQMDERLAKAAKIAPKREGIPDIAEQIVVETPVVEYVEPVETFDEVKSEPKVDPTMTTAAEDNKDLLRFEDANFPATEPNFDPRWALVLGITKEEE